jgi:prepilin-type N-terminal cleavage/methylation domain-containing protein/prepilin-type processing-associated H-X9-DG protein
MAGDEGLTMRNRMRAFTLVELLIVISIITILAGMLFPVFARARDRARHAACVSNERQLGLALLQYTQDWDERFPSGGRVSTGQGWAGQAFPYIRSCAIYRCPQDPGNRADDDDDEEQRTGERISYGLNCNLAGALQGELSAPTSTVMLFEVNDAVAQLVGPEWSSPTGRGLPTDNAPKLGKPFGADYYATGNLGGISPRLSTTRRPYHDPFSNYLAADGHVKSNSGDRVSPGADAPDTEAKQDSAAGTAAGTGSMLVAPGVRAGFTFSRI